MPVPQPEEVMELASELRAARSRVADLESRWKSFFSNNAAMDATIAAVSAMHLKPRIIKFLEDRPDLGFNMASVAKALDAKENSVGPYLSDLVKDEKIERRGRGMYGALRPPADDGDPFALEVQEKSPATNDR